MFDILLEIPFWFLDHPIVYLVFIVLIIIGSFWLVRKKIKKAISEQIPYIQWRAARWGLATAVVFFLGYSFFAFFIGGLFGLADPFLYGLPVMAVGFGIGWSVALALLSRRKEPKQPIVVPVFIFLILCFLGTQFIYGHYFSPASGNNVAVFGTSLAISPNGKEMIFQYGPFENGAGAETLYLGNTDGSGIQKLTLVDPNNSQHQLKPFNVVFAPDGQHLFFIDNIHRNTASDRERYSAGYVYEVAKNGGPVTKVGNISARAMTIDPQRNLIYYLQDYTYVLEPTQITVEGNVQTINRKKDTTSNVVMANNLDGSPEHQLVDLGDGYIEGLSLSEDGAILIFNNKGRIGIFNLETKTGPYYFTPPSGYSISSPSVAALNSHQILVSLQNTGKDDPNYLDRSLGEIYRWNIATEQLVRLTYFAPPSLVADDANPRQGKLRINHAENSLTFVVYTVGPYRNKLYRLDLTKQPSSDDCRWDLSDKAQRAQCEQNAMSTVQEIKIKIP